MAAPETDIREFTLRAVLLGVVLAVVMTAANVYIGLYAGLTVSASIPAAVVSMAVLRGLFRSGTIRENNIAQTAASAGESLAAGAIFTLPALVLAGAWTDFAFWPSTLIALLGGLLGVVFMVPLRRALIVERKELTYPEGVACAEVLRAGERGAAGALPMVYGFLAAALLKILVSGVSLVRGTLETAFGLGRSVTYAGLDVSAALVAVGYIVRLNIAVQVFAGGFIGWVLVMPMLPVPPDMAAAAPLDIAWTLWSTRIRYLGVGAMIVGGFYSIWRVRRGILQGVKRLRPARRDGAVLERTDRDLGGRTLAILVAAAFLGIVGLYSQVLGHWTPAVGAAFMMIAASFLFVAVASYIVGLVGSSNSPVSGMTICALLMTAGLMLALGVSGTEAVVATLTVAGVVCCAAATAGDVSQDLKTGRIVGATPASQQWAQLAGIGASAFVIAPILSLLHNSYGIGTGAEGSLKAPQADLFRTLVAAIFQGGVLPWGLIAAGAGLGLAVIALDTVLERKESAVRAYVMPVAVGLYLPFSLSVSMLAGGLIRYAVDRKRAASAEDPGVLFGSGLIAGEALTGIAIALPLTLGVALPQLGASAWGGLAAFAALVLVYRRVAMGRKP